MKKHLLTVVLAMVMLASCVLPAAAASYYEDLWGKFDRQMDSGSGYIATVTGKSEGSSILNGLGLSLNGLTGDVTLIRDQRQPENYQATLKIKKGDAPAADILVFGDAAQTVLQGDFLNQSITLPFADAADLFLDSEKDYGWIQMLMALNNCEDEIWLAQMEKAGEDYRLDFEMWLTKYATVSNDLLDGAMTISYAIPAEDLKVQMRSMLVQLMNDEDMLAVIKQLLTAEQAERYLQPNWVSQYLNILNGIELNGEVEVTHKQSMKGEVLSTRVVLPVPAHLSTDYETFTVEADDAHWLFSLKGENTLALRWDKQIDGSESKASGSLTVDTKDFKAEAEFAFEGEKKASKDAENREYLTDNWKLTVTNGKPGTEGYLAFEPMTVIFNAALNSGPDRRNATYTDISLTLEGPEGKDTLSLSGKTATNWKLIETDAAGAKALNEMDAESLTELLGDVTGELLTWVAP